VIDSHSALLSCFFEGRNQEFLHKWQVPEQRVRKKSGSLVAMRTSSQGRRWDSSAHTNDTSSRLIRPHVMLEVLRGSTIGSSVTDGLVVTLRIIEKKKRSP